MDERFLGRVMGLEPMIFWATTRRVNPYTTPAMSAHQAAQVDITTIALGGQGSWDKEFLSFAFPHRIIILGHIGTCPWPRGCYNSPYDATLAQSAERSLRKR